jgi:Mn2+/Fe2+ NRAMP family transporter
MKGVEWIRKREVVNFVLFVVVIVALMYLASLGYESRADLETKRRIAENSQVALCEWLNFLTSAVGKAMAAALIATGLLSWLVASRAGREDKRDALLWKVLSATSILATVFFFFIVPYSPVFTGFEYTPGMACETLRGR